MRYSQQLVTAEDETAVLEVLRSDYLTQGPAIERFEAALAEYVGVKHCVAVSSGTAALHLAYLAALPWMHPDDEGPELVTSPLSFVATANAGLMAGYSVRFRDVDATTGNQERGGSLTDLEVTVHFAGRARAIENYVAPVIEDACHALGATDFDGCSRVGSCAHSLATVFSFHPVKPICTGEGGAVTTNDEGFAQTIRELRSHGRDSDGLMRRLGYNYRMDEMSAALGLSQLKRCDEMRGRRQRLAERYRNSWPFSPDIATAPGCHDQQPFMATDAWHLFTARIKNGRRDEVKSKLNAAGIGAQVHYSPIIPLQPYYRERFGYKEGDFPQAEAWASEELSLPLHAGMTEKDVEHVVDTLREALR